MEALSRGAAHATFVEKAGIAIDALSANITAFKMTRKTAIVRGDVMRPGTALGSDHSLVFTDPPYDQNAAVASLRHGLDVGAIASGALLCLDADRSEEKALDASGLDILWSKEVGPSLLAIARAKTPS